MYIAKRYVHENALLCTYFGLFAYWKYKVR